ncbi:MAG: hypothetical protein IT453_11270 [Planctomycetes bacterium]|nr:hypothetical protein [Planctomycetota bacterium]
MNPSKLDKFLATVRARWPQYRIVAVPFTADEDPAIQHFVHLLDVPDDAYESVSDRAWELAFDLFGDEELPFVMTTIDPDTSANHFPVTTAEAG